MQMVLEKSEYPEPIAGEAEVRFDEASRTAIVSFWLPNPEDVPKIIEFKFVASRKATNSIEMKQKEFDVLSRKPTRCLRIVMLWVSTFSSRSRQRRQ